MNIFFELVALFVLWLLVFVWVGLVGIIRYLWPFAFRYAFEDDDQANNIEEDGAYNPPKSNPDYCSLWNWLVIIGYCPAGTVKIILIETHLF